MHPSPASIASLLTFPHIHNAHMRNCRQKLTVRCAKVLSFGDGFAPEPPLEALPLDAAGGFASRPHYPHQQILDPPLS